MTPTKEIKLNPKVTDLLKELSSQLEGLRNNIQSINGRMADLLTGVCLTEQLDLTTQIVELSPDLTTLYVFTEDSVKEEVSAKKATKRKN